MPQTEIVDQDKPRRQRSPNYPAVGLREGVDRVKKLFATSGRAGAPPKLAAVHIGFRAAHSQAMSVLAALKRFGLVSEASGRVVPTHSAIEILHLSENDSRRQTALSEAALSPPLYRELVEQHRQTGLPSRDVLEQELVIYKRFNPSAVSGLVTDFLDTLEYAGISLGGTIDSAKKQHTAHVKTGDFVQWVSQGVVQFRELKKVTGFSDDGNYAFLDGEKTAAPVAELEVGDVPEASPHAPTPRNPRGGQRVEGARAVRQDVFSPDDLGEVKISWPVPLTQGDGYRH